MSAFSLPIPPEVVAHPPSQAYGTLRYRVPQGHTHSFGARLEPRYIVRAGTLV